MLRNLVFSARTVGSYLKAKNREGQIGRNTETGRSRGRESPRLMMGFGPRATLELKPLMKFKPSFDR